MSKALTELLNNYSECMFYESDRVQAAVNGDVAELSNIGTDFARSGMFEDAIGIWEYIINGGMPTNPETYNNLGVSYYYGNGVEINYTKAVHYYQKAAAAGHRFGQYNFAVALENGNGIPVDMDRAIEYYKKAAYQHVNQAIDALIRLGVYDEMNLAYYSRSFHDTSFLGDNI